MLQVDQVNAFNSWLEKMVSLDIFNLDSTSESKLDQVCYKFIAPNSFAWGEALLHHGCLSYGVASDHFDVASLEHWSGRFEKEHKTNIAILEFEVSDHQRMNVLTNIGLMALFQFAQASNIYTQRVCPSHPFFWMLFWQILMSYATHVTSYNEARRLVPLATCWLAIPCSTWIFMLLV